MEMLEEQRETWGTRGGFVLAAVGSAVGLGNLWGFPYKLYDNGGGAFLIPYVIAMICIGVPMLIMEFSLGHFTQRAAPDAFGRCNKKLEFVGWWGIILGFVIITYYPTILGYCFSFMFHSLVSIVTDTPLPWGGEGIEGVENASKFFFTTHLTEGKTILGIQYNLFVPLLVAWVAMYLCIFKGVNLVGKIVWITVPLPFIMLIVLTIRGLTLPGSMKGLAYYLDPTWSELLKPTTWRYAFGQVFFSLSLAFGVMITYASFLHRKSDINNNAAIIAISDLATSFVGGIAIFATLGGMSYATFQAGAGVPVEEVVDGGPGLAFVAFPYALAQLPGAAWWSFIFFFTLVTLGIDSAFSITESVLAGIVDKTGWRRCFVLPAMSFVGLVAGLIYVTKGGLDWIGTIDGFINGTWGIAFLGLLECVVIGWLYRVENLRVHANERSDWHLGKWWNYSIRIFIPLVLGTLFVWSLIDDFTNEAGFIKTPDGQWNVYNCVGLCVVAIAPVIAILASLFKTPSRGETSGVQRELNYPPARTTTAGGWTAIVLSGVAALFMIYAVFAERSAVSFERPLMVLAFGMSVAGLIIANSSMIGCDWIASRPSRLAGVAGIMSTFNISTFFAMVLSAMSPDKVDDTARKLEKLSGVSYAIIAVVVVIVFGGLGWCFYRAIAAGGDED